MPTQFNIDDESFRAIVSRGIIESISDESKTAMVGAAVEYLLAETPNPSTRYGDPKTLPSPLTLAFQNAVRGIAQDVVKEYINQDKVREIIAAGVRQHVQTLLEDEGGWLVDAVGMAVGNAITVRPQTER